MLRFNQVTAILEYLADKLHDMDDGLVQQYIKTHSNSDNDHIKFYYSQYQSSRGLHYKGIRLHYLTPKEFEDLLVSNFLENIISDAKEIVEEARTEQILPYLTRIDKL